MKNKKRWFCILLSLILTITLFGCKDSNVAVQNTGGTQTPEHTTAQLTGEGGSGEVPNTENYRVNEEIACEQYDYDNAGGWDMSNLTETGAVVKDGMNDHFASFAALILSDYDSYSTLWENVLENQSVSFEKSTQCVLPEGITEEIFEQHDLLMIDFMKYGAMSLYPRLENLCMEDSKVSIDLQYDGFFTSAGNNHGVMYFIPIPKGCTEAEVTPIHTSFAGE